jgi:hypothetical protein
MGCAGACRRPGRPRGTAAAAVLVALALAAAVGPAAGSASYTPIATLTGANDPDPYWNDLFGGGLGAGVKIFNSTTNVTTYNWTENPYWAAPGVGPQLQWWNSRTRERGRSPRRERGRRADVRPVTLPAR